MKYISFRFIRVWSFNSIPIICFSGYFNSNSISFVLVDISTAMASDADQSALQNDLALRTKMMVVLDENRALRIQIDELKEKNCELKTLVGH